MLQYYKDIRTIYVYFVFSITPFLLLDLMSVNSAIDLMRLILSDSDFVYLLEHLSVATVTIYYIINRLFSVFFGVRLHVLLNTSIHVRVCANSYLFK